MSRPLLSLAALLLCAIASAADAPAAAPATAPATAPVADAAPLTAKVDLVVPEGAKAGPDFDVERATQAWIETLSAEQRAKSDAYFEGGYWLQLFAFLYALVIAWIFLGLRLSAWLRDRAAAITGNPTLQSTLYALMYVVAVSLLAFPLSLYSDFYREHAYGMANQTLTEWLGDQAKGLAVGLVMGAIFITVIYAVFRWAQRTWWVWATGVTMVFLVFAIAIAPVVIDPLFNKYQSLPVGPLRDDILGIAHGTGVPADDVVWFDASRQTKRISANVAGFGGSTRVALNDNLLNRSPQESIEAVMGHELGHYVLNHIYESLVYLCFIYLLGFALVAKAFDRVVAKHGARFGISGIADPAGLPLIGVLFTVYMFVLTPVMNSVIRVNEAEADRFGIAVSGQPDGFAFVAMQLSEYRKISPGAWEEVLFYDHPSGHNRVKAAMEWKAEMLRRQGVLKPTP